MLNAPALLTVFSFLLTTLSDSIFGGVLDVRLLDVTHSYCPHGPHQGRSSTETRRHRRDEPQQESSALYFCLT